MSVCVLVPFARRVSVCILCYLLCVCVFNHLQDVCVYSVPFVGYICVCVCVCFMPVVGLCMC